MSKKNKLEKKVIKFKPIRDPDNKRFLPYCDFGYHQGYIKKPEVCEERNCRHYHKLYLN